MFSEANAPERELQSDISALALFPRISVRDSRLQVQQAQSFEIGLSPDGGFAVLQRGGLQRGHFQCRADHRRRGGAVPGG